MKIAMACALLSPPVFYILETMWTVAFRVLGLILAATMFSCISRTQHQAGCVRPITRPIPTTHNFGHPLLEMPQHRSLTAGDRDRQHLAFGGRAGSTVSNPRVAASNLVLA